MRRFSLLNALRTIFGTELTDVRLDRAALPGVIDSHPH